MNDYEVARFHHFDGVNHADITDVTNPGYYEGATLVAKRYVTSYSVPGSDSNGNPLGTVVNKYSPNDTIGTIYSYWVDPSSGLVWWEMTDNKNEWLLHQTGYFDSSVAEGTASGTTFNNQQNALANATGFFNSLKNGATDVVNKVGNDLSGIFGDLKWYIIAALVIGALILFSNLKRAL